MAEVVRVAAQGGVTETVEKLSAAIDGAGAKVFAVVDHGAGAVSIGSDVGASQLVIFGNPQVGTPAIEANRLAGLRLPLKVLVYADAGGRCGWRMMIRRRRWAIWRGLRRMQTIWRGCRARWAT